MPRLSPPLDKMSRSRDSRGTAKPLPGRSKPHDGGELFQQIGKGPPQLFILKYLPKATSGMTKQLRRRLTAELSNPSGEFAKALSAQLVRELQQQIDVQTQKVEIQIQ